MVSELQLKLIQKKSTQGMKVVEYADTHGMVQTEQDDQVL